MVVRLRWMHNSLRDEATPRGTREEDGMDVSKRPSGAIDRGWARTTRMVKATLMTAGIVVLSAVATRQPAAADGQRHRCKPAR